MATEKLEEISFGLIQEGMTLRYQRERDPEEKTGIVQARSATTARMKNGDIIMPSDWFRRVRAAEESAAFTPVRVCAHCGAPLPDDAHPHRKYCNDTCRTAAKMEREKETREAKREKVKQIRARVDESAEKPGDGACATTGEVGNDDSENAKANVNAGNVFHDAILRNGAMPRDEIMGMRVFPTEEDARDWAARMLGPTPRPKPQSPSASLAVGMAAAIARHAKMDRAAWMRLASDAWEMSGIIV